ncbi:hypothetical protein K439DRAFT_1619181 [Ramaria rubella]|nr:hypothetical protein K439DRAFT_1619181 [Ramaria rubella]
MPPLPPLSPTTYDLHTPRVRFAAVPRTLLALQGEFEALLGGVRGVAGRGGEGGTSEKTGERGEGEKTRERGESNDAGAEPLLEHVLATLLTAQDGHAWSIDAVKRAYVLLPVHELQIPSITLHVPSAILLPPAYSVPAHAQASIRTLTLPSAPTLSLKLPINMTISSALRTISHYTTHFAPRFARAVLPHLAIDPEVLIVERERASAALRGRVSRAVLMGRAGAETGEEVGEEVGEDVRKHVAAVVREVYSGEERGERVIMCASLAEIGFADEDDEQTQRLGPGTTFEFDATGLDAGVPLAVTALGLVTPALRLAFLARYIDLVFDAFLPPLLVNGVAFEAHGQNTLARFDGVTGELRGFVFRDFGGMRVHAGTLEASTGVDILGADLEGDPHADANTNTNTNTNGNMNADDDDDDTDAPPPLTLPTHCIIVPTLQSAHRRLYHTLIHSHLHRLIRVLGFHHSGVGWGLVRRSLEGRIGRGSVLWGIGWVGGGVLVGRGGFERGEDGDGEVFVEDEVGGGV